MTVIEPELRTRLKELSARTRVPANAYVREAIADLLAKYADVLKPGSGTTKTGKRQRRP
jgi:predicted DNA-binding protein